MKDQILEDLTRKILITYGDNTRNYAYDFDNADIDQNTYSARLTAELDYASENFLALVKIEVENVLDRLIAQQWSFGAEADALAVPTRYIEAEKQRLNDKEDK